MQICKFKQTDLKISRMIIRVVEYIVIFYTYKDCPGVGEKIKQNHRHKKGVSRACIVEIVKYLE